MIDEIPASSRAARIAAAATRLQAAAALRAPCPPVRDLLGTTDIDAAYEVQQIVRQSRCEQENRVVVGRKIGLTSEAVQNQVGVAEPDFGVLLDDMDVSAMVQVPSARLLQPRAEVEIAFVLAQDVLDDVDDIEKLAKRVAFASAAIEIVDSRVEAWDIAITDTVADNASSGLYVIGEKRLGLDEFVPRDVSMEMFVNGVRASVGDGRACLGDPLRALQWLARTALRYGDPLRAGQVVLSGALGPLVPTPPGTHIRAEISQLGSVGAQFSSKEME